MAPKLFLIFNHTVTPNQETDARSTLGVKEIIPLPAELQSLWSNVPPALHDIRDYVEPIVAYLECNASRGDYVLIQGDFGACWLLVSAAFAMGLIPIYSTTERRAIEERLADGSIHLIHRFDHVRFRRYGG